MDLKVCAKALCKKLKQIEKHPSYHSTFVIAANHGFPYSGPTYKQELEDLVNCLGESEKIHQDRDFGDENAQKSIIK